MGKKKYTPIAHFNGTLVQEVSITEKLPWIYIIALLEKKSLYIGETFDEAGIMGRLSSHFGRTINSSLKECAAKNAGIHNITSPYLVIVARLPFNDDSAPFNGENKKVRKACESYLHEIILTEFVLPNQWTLISSASTSIKVTDEMKNSCQEILYNFMASYTFLENLSSKILPLNLVVLDRLLEAEPNTPSIGDMIEDIELQLFDWVIKTLTMEYDDEWWVRGVKNPIRIRCATTQESEGEGNNIPKWGYLTLIDLKEIIESNWELFSGVMEEVSNFQGKAKATRWIKDINEKRKLWAHPLKQRFVSIDPSDVNQVKTYQSKLRKAIQNDIDIDI